MKVRAFVIIKDNEEKKFLLIRESNLKFQNKWFFPGGIVDEKERIADAVIREAKEETGYNIAVNGVWLIKYISLPITEKGLYIYCSGRMVGGTLKTEYDEHSMEARWFDLNEIAELETRSNLKELMSIYSDELPVIPTEQLALFGN